LSEAEATKLISQVCPGAYEREADQAVAIARELSGMPLAVRVMASYIDQTQDSLENLLKGLRSADARRLFSDEESARALQYERTLAACCEMSINTLGESSRHLVRVLAFFQPDSIHESLITKGCAKLPRLASLQDHWTWNAELRKLANYNLVPFSNSGSSSGRTLRIHRFLKAYCVHPDDKDREFLVDAFRDAVDLINDRFPKRPPDGGTMTKSWKECEEWLPHVLYVKAAFATSGLPQTAVPKAYVEVLCNTSWYMWERGTDRALDCVFDAYILGKMILTDDAPDDYLLKADILTLLGATKLPFYKRRDETCEYFMEALEVLKQYRDKKPDMTENEKRLLANAYNNAGAGELNRERYDRARVLFEEGFRQRKRIGTQDAIPYDYAVSYYNLCRVKMGKGILCGAIENAGLALNLAEKCNGSTDFRTNQFRFTYADLLVACDKVEEGLGVHLETLKIRQESLGINHNETGVSHYGIGCVLFKLKRLEEAL